MTRQGIPINIRERRNYPSHSECVYELAEPDGVLTMVAIAEGQCLESILRSGWLGNA